MSIRVNTVRTRVNVSAIQSHFTATGIVGKEAREAGRAIKRAAIQAAPSRTGTLKARHTGPRSSPTTLGTHVVVGNDSDHALFVHEGTHGPILPHNSTGYLWVRPSPHSWYAPNYSPFGYEINAGGRTPRRSVRGQRANPWLARAMSQQTGVRYGAV
jgi:hypothetical protein